MNLTSGYLTADSGTLWAQGGLGLKSHNVSGKAQVAEVDLGAVGDLCGQKKLGGVGYGSATLGGTLREPTGDGSVVLFKPRYGDYELNALTARATYLDDNLELQDFHADYHRAVASGQATLTGLRAKKQEAGLEGSVQVEGFNLERLGDILHRDLPAAGLAEASVLVSGTLKEPQAKGVVRLAHGRYDEYLVDRAEIPLVADRKRLTVTNGTARAYGANLRFKGEAQFTKPVVLDAKLSGSGLRIAGLAPLWEMGLPVLGEITIPEAWLQGPVDNLRGGGQVSCLAASVAGQELRDVQAQWGLVDETISLPQFSCEVAGGTAKGKGAFSLKDNTHPVNADIQLTDTDISRLLALATPLAGIAAAPEGEPKRDSLQRQLRSLSLRLAGHTQAHLQAEGPLRSPRVTCTVKSQDCALDGRPMPVVEATGTKEGRRWHDLSMALSQGQALVTVDGNVDLDGQVDAIVQGSAIDLAQMRPWLRLQLPVGGRVSFTVAASGATHHPDLQASVDVENPSLAGVRFDMLNLPVATLTEGKLAVDTLILKRGKQEILIDGELPFSYEVPHKGADGKTTTAPGLRPEGTVRMQARIGQTSLAFFPPLFEEFQRAQSKAGASHTSLWSDLDASGTVDSAVTVGGTVADTQVRGFLKLAEGAVLSPRWSQPLKPLTADLVFSGSGSENTVEVHDLSAGLLGAIAKLTGTVRLDRNGLKQPERNAYDLRLMAEAQEVPLPIGSKLTNLQGGFSLTTPRPGNHLIKALPLTCGLGGGKLALTGQATLTHFAVADLARNDYDLHLAAQRCRLRYQPLADAILDGGLALVTPQGARTRVEGRLALSNGIFMAGSSRKGPRKEPLALSSSLPDPDLDVVVALGPGIAVRGSGVTAPLDPNPAALVIAGTPQRPTITGSVGARRGSVALPSGRLAIDEFRVNFALAPVSGMRSDPLPLELTGSVVGKASTTLTPQGSSTAQSGESIHISLDISGNLPDQVRLQATSEPALSEAQIIALLGGLSTASLSGSTPTDGLTNVLSERFLSTLATAFKARLFDPFEEELKRRLGLAELGVNFTLDQPVSVKVGKYVLENLLVTYERSLTQGPEAYNLEVSYQMPSGVRVIYHRDELGDSRVRVGYTFGF